MENKFVVTGGAGFIGSHLAQALYQDNEVLVIDDLTSGKRENLSNIDVEFIKGSITDIDLLKRAFVDADCVYHLAAIASVQKSVKDPLGTNKVNVEGTLNVLKAARDAGVERVIFASSAAVYGDSPQLPKDEEMRPDPKSPYAVSKLAGEGYLMAFNEIYGMKNIALRYFNVYGPRQDPSSEYSGVISKFVSAALEGNVPVIHGDGMQNRDFVYVKDVMRANVLASDYGKGGVFNIASGKSTSLNELVKIIGQIMGRNVDPIYSDFRPGDIRHSLADISKAKAMGHAPMHSIEEGLRDLVIN